MPSWIYGAKRPFQIGLAVAILTALLSLFLPNYYQSEARILPVETKGLSGGLGGLSMQAAAFGISIPGAEGSDGNFVDILGSRWMREQLLRTRFEFHEKSWRFGKNKMINKTLLEYLEMPNMDRGVGKISQMFTSSRDLKSRVLTITAETRSPELSYQMIHRSLALLESFVQEKGRTRGGNKAIFAESRLKEARREFSVAEDELRRFLDQNRNFQISADPRVRLEGIRLESQLKLHQQLLMTLAMNREQALMEEKNDIPLLNVMDPGSLPIEKSRPSRSALVLGLFFLTFATVWGWLNRAWLRGKLAGFSD